ncbi:serine/threonine-protein phosphatase [Candidatus Woesearchaeota archaeon]|jgi:hypothetical protein|nr:serine/threonine-protein phosphatase [Candidatus Woesearchaeota archaeon]MBT4835577.1 serine/threonine-protein phosphatase [Candidatus Woesearchaeota archaeon]MBT6734933.1 serine/threonine-protein phosphatase [Candidatus Woesearchaeota archaeon]MBT7169770.1 serine/threonine-protein phosphatase [Candidatus Woesearchaeota archaeon]MBT7474434.1 serine/threonine-protein phosphatase [Candidatus Woesearchaeota archaeon]
MISMSLEISRKVAPKTGKLPELDNLDIYGTVIPLLEEGGDRITWISFKDRYPLDKWSENVLEGGKDHIILPALENISEDIKTEIINNYRSNLSNKILEHKKKAGIAMTDVAGHNDEALIINAAFHQSLLNGILDHLPIRGEVPVALFENLNTRFKSTDDFKSSLALLYGEISESGNFRYIAANTHEPILYSAQYDTMLRLKKTHNSALPIGFALSSYSGADETGSESDIIKPPYEINEIDISPGDILLLYSDGLYDHEIYLENNLEKILSENTEKSSEEICQIMKQDILKSQRDDDISYTIIKKHHQKL